MKKTLALFVAFVMVFSMIPSHAFAAATPTISLTASASENLKVGDTFTVTAGLSNNSGFGSLTLSLLWNSEVVKFTGFSETFDDDDEVYKLTDTILGQTVIYDNETGKVANARTSNSSKNGVVFIANFEVVGYGECNLGIDQSSATAFTYADVSGTDLDLNVDVTSISSLTVTEPTTPAADYEIWYELDSTTDTDSDNYTDYDIDTKSQVTATVYIVSNNADVTLQAYDIYLTYGPNLSYNSETMDGIAYVDGATAGTEATEGSAVTHIQLAANTKTYALTKGEKVALGTIVFDIVNTAVYDEGMAITLTPGSADQGEDCTNIAIGADEKAYYPSTTQDLKGAEVMTTYEVTYDANTTDTVTGKPATQTKEYNKPLTLSTDTPTREGYTFQGWSTDSGDNNTVNAGTTYETNADEVFYAVWKQNDFTVSFDMNGHGTQIEAASITPNGKVTKPTDPTATGYTFDGWYTDVALTNAYNFDNAVTSSFTLYAKWTINKYDVTFNMNGRGGTIDKQKIEYNKTATTPAAPTADGYTFGGWYTEAACTNEFDFSTAITADTELFAKWTANTINVTLNPNYTDATTSEIEVTYDSTYGDKLTTPTRTGYTFAGWYTAADDSGTKVESTTAVTNASAHTLYAHWTPITYTVTFDANGGEGTAPGTITGIYDQTFAMPAGTGLSKTDYVFAGWSTDKNATKATYTAGSSYSNLANTQGATVTLYAVWVKDVYSITYTNDPDAVTVTSTLPSTYSSATGLEITDPTATGYTFVGWTSTALNITTATKDISIPAGTDGAVDLTAHWTINQYTITFNTDGGTTIDPITQDYGTAVTAPANPTKTGYTFNGWDKEIPATMPGENVTITANWTINQYTITFNTDGGTTIAPITQDYGTAVTAPADPTKTGYTFNGWSATIPATMPAEDVTITAQWTEHTYSVTFNKPEGVTFADTVEDKTGVKYTESVTLPSASEVTKTGYTLIGFTQAEGKTTIDDGYTPGASVSGMTAVNNGSVTLYPVFKEATYTLSFNLGDHPATGETAPNSIAVTYNGTYSGLPADVNPANGYKFLGWYIGDTKIESTSTVAITGDSTATARYEAIEYTITFVVPNGTEIAAQKYTIESEYTLPSATHNNSLYSFKNWLASDVNGSWIATEYNAGTAVTGKYGDVTLTAQWNEVLTYTIEEYKYAAEGYMLLMIATNSNTNAYTFGGEQMFYTTDENYVNSISGATGVFYTLIPTKDGDTVLVDSNMKLTEAGMAKLAPSENAAATITYNGDINGDNFVNVADANIVYQMVQLQGIYYSTTQLTTAQRLAADMDRATDNVTKRGSIADVNAIINIINNVATN